MPATFSRLHTWNQDDVIQAADLNAEFNNILNNLDPSGVGDWSVNAAQMQLQTSPGTVGSESLATALSGEIQRLRYVIKQILGASATYWYSTLPTDLTQLKNAIGGTLVNNRIVSGQSSTLSSAARFLIPAGSGTAQVTVAGATTALVYAILGVNYTIASNINVTVSVATAATAIVNDSNLSGQEYSKWQGEDGSILNITNASASILSLAGNYGAFQVVDSSGTEYFMGYVQNSTQFTSCLRGFFLDQSSNYVPRVTINNNDTISMLKLTWLYASTASKVVVGYTNPTFSYAQPGSPNTGDYWYDMATQAWMTFNSATWVTAYATLIGVCAQNTSGCVAARAFDVFNNGIPYSNIILDYAGTASIIARNYGSKIGVGSNLISFTNTKPTWSSSSLDNNVNFTSSTTYWAYVGENGQLTLSSYKPYQSSGSGQGWYHPFENWRAVGYMQTNSSTAFDVNTLYMYHLDANSDTLSQVADLRNIGFSATVNSSALVVSLTSMNGQELSNGNPAYVTFRNSNQTLGTSISRRITANINITAPVGASLGIYASVNQYVWIYLLDNNGTVDVGLMQRPLAPSVIADGYVPASWTQIGGTSTANTVLYSAGGSSSGAVRLAGRLLVNEANPGTWATTPTNIAVNPTPIFNITDWNNNLNFTPAVNAFGTTITNPQYFTRRVGDTLECRLSWQNQSSNGNLMTVGLPFNIDTASGVKFPGGGYIQMLGQWVATNGGAGNILYGTANMIGPVAVNGTALSTLILAQGGQNASMTPANANAMGGATQVMSLTFAYPVFGWSAYGP